MESVLDELLEVRLEARGRKDFEKADRVRDLLAKHGVQVQDDADGSTWELNDEAGESLLEALLQGAEDLRQTGD